jgi:hypothetical protein
MRKVFIIAAAVPVSVGMSANVFAAGRGGGGGFGPAGGGSNGFGGNTWTTPPDLVRAKKQVGKGQSKPPGWVDHGNKQGWGGNSQPPGLQRR